MTLVRHAAVSGQFYPAEPIELRRVVRAFVDEATLHETAGRGKVHGERAIAVGTEATGCPRGLIVPHAGYVYSGPIAASAYVRLIPFASRTRRVVLVGPSHRVPLRGLAASHASAFETPLGRVIVDEAAMGQLLELPQISWNDAAHQREHSLEVQLPFLQVVLPEFRLVPLVIGTATADEVSSVFDVFADDPQTVFVVSSDLSHYHDASTASRLDQATSASIERLADEELSSEKACGFAGIRGLLRFARRRHLQAITIDLRNSGDTAGPRDSVVGYGAYVVA